MFGLTQTEQICFMGLIIFSISSWFQLTGFMAFGRDTFSRFQTPSRITWFFMELPNLIWVFYFAYQNNFQINLPMFLFMIHYLNRTIVYPLRSKSNSKIPLLASTSAAIFTTFNGYIQYKGNIRFGFVDQITFVQILGIFAFASGMLINIISDEILCVKRGKATTTNKYSNVDDFLFKYVTMANYLGQIIQWIGYALVAQTPASILFACSTVSVLLSAGIVRHRWNTKNIPNYPNKKAVIPFII